MTSFHSSYAELGSFIHNGSCFELTKAPVRRWRNSLYNSYGGKHFNSVVEDVGDGSTSVRMEDGENVTIVSHENKYLYIRNDKTLKTFCPAGTPLTTPVEEYSCRITPYSSELHSRCEEMEVHHRVFVPKDYCVEVWTARVTNHSKEEQQLSVFAYANFGFPQDWPLIADVEPEIGGVFAYRRNTKNPNDPHRGFLCAIQDYHAATGTRECFLQRGYNASTPKLLDGEDLDNRSGIEYFALAAVQSKITVKPGEEKRVDFLLGHAMTVEEIKEIRSAFTAQSIDRMCREQKEIETERAKPFQVDLQHPDLNAMMNHFVKKQLYSYLINKSHYRDNLQVIMALSMSDYDTCEKVLMKALSAQHPEGWAPHHFNPLENIRVSDAPVWILMVVPWMIKESGDFDLLKVPLPFQIGDEEVSLWEHVLRAMRFLVKDTGKNGLCDLREGDWNDGLSPIGESCARESVMVTQQLCYGLLEVAELAEVIGEKAVAEEANTWHQTFAQRLNAVAWDGEWYQRVLCEDGFVIGTKSASEGCIFQNSQSWAIMGRVASQERAERAMESVEKHLKLDIGYRVVYPPFTTYDPRVGQSTTVAPGCTENGGCYNHAAGFKLVADCMLGRAEEAWETFRKVAPGNPDNPPSRSGAEAMAFVNMYRAHDYVYGESLYAWNTGTAAWMTFGLIEWILGARRDYAGLRIDPCLTKEITRAQVVRTFRGARFDIRLDNSAGRSTGTTSITLNGDPIQGNLLPDLRSGEHRVNVVI